MPQHLRRFGPYILLVAVVFLVYGDVYSFSFLYDDEFLLQKNRFLDSFGSIVQMFSSNSTAGAGFTDSFYRPLQGFLYLLVKQTFGPDTWGFHFLNISLHAANAVLIFALGLRLRLPKWSALCAALLWAVHPLHTEAVTYMSATADPLHTLCILAAIVVMVPDFTPARQVLGALLFCLGLISKESAIVFPALLVTIIFFLEPDRWNWRRYLKTLPFWGVAFVYLLLRKTALNFNQDFDMYKQSNIYTEHILYRIETFLATLPSYFELLVAPHDLHMDRAFPVYIHFDTPVLLGACIAALAIFAIARTWRHKKDASIWAAWAALWFFAAQVPQSGILIPTNSFFLEHWMYVPSISIFLWLGYGLSRLESGSVRRLAVATVAVAASALAWVTHLQNQTWESPITFYSRILQYNPHADRIRHNLAMAYSDRGEIDRALEQYKIVLQDTDQYPQTNHNIARIYALKGQLDLAEQNELSAIRKDPRFFPAYAALVEIYQRLGRPDKAQEFEKKFRELTH